MLEGLGYLFYIVNPMATYFERVEQVPAYITEAIPFFVGLIVLEQLIAFCKGMQLMKLNDAITSAAQGILMEQSKILVPGFTFAFYIWLYDRYRLLDLPCNSIWIWVLTMLVIDFGFYWFHRWCHEVNILWASHQAHHSSEYFNLTTALRQSLFQLYLHSLFYLPLALFIPPSVFLVHFEFNTLFQFWIHTELIDQLGPLGYVFNTPSHHRVHHGRNRYCIDKNYASVLIIWDRMFGTFAAEEEKVVYGLTHPVRSFSVAHLQLHPYKDIWNRIRSASTLSSKLSVLFKGPGWSEGKPRLGLIEDIPDVRAAPCDGCDAQDDQDKSNSSSTMATVVEPYQPLGVPFRYQIYCVVHFFLVILFHVFMAERCVKLSQSVTFLLFAFVFLSLTSFGALMDGRPYAKVLELGRCVFFFLLDVGLLPGFGSTNLLTFALIKSFFATSLLYWVFRCAQSLEMLPLLREPGLKKPSRLQLYKKLNKQK